MAILESKVQQEVLRKLRKQGCYVYKNAQNMYTEKGRPDLTACVPVTIKQLAKMFGEDASVGLFLGLELKRPGRLNGVSEAQEVVGRQIRNASGLWLLSDSPEYIEQYIVNLQRGE